MNIFLLSLPQIVLVPKLPRHDSLLAPYFAAGAQDEVVNAGE